MESEFNSTDMGLQGFELVTNLWKSRWCIQLDKGTRPTYKAIFVSDKLGYFNMSSFKTIVPVNKHK